MGHVIKLVNGIIDVANREYFFIKSYVDKSMLFFPSFNKKRIFHENTAYLKRFSLGSVFLNNTQGM